MNSTLSKRTRAIRPALAFVAGAAVITTAYFLTSSRSAAPAQARAEIGSPATHGMDAFSNVQAPPGKPCAGARSLQLATALGTTDSPIWLPRAKDAATVDGVWACGPGPGSGTPIITANGVTITYEPWPSSDPKADLTRIADGAAELTAIGGAPALVQPAQASDGQNEILIMLDGYSINVHDEASRPMSEIRAVAESLDLGTKIGSPASIPTIYARLK